MVARRILFADIGTTFTKVCLLERTGDTWRIRKEATSPTTVDSPDLDVMIGVRSAIGKLESWSGIKILSQNQLVSPSSDSSGIDEFRATSSAGGGLQVLVAGLTEAITVESGHRAALGAGAVVTEVVSLHQVNTDSRSIERIRNVPCDMVLITGGTDGGNISDVLTLAEFLSLASPKPRFDTHAKTPLVYAGNTDAHTYLEGIIGDSMELICVDNIRPTVETESLQPVRNVIQDIFLRHVMSHAPGFRSLALWAQDKVKPTPAALGTALSYISSKKNCNILAVDVGGATTDVFSTIDGRFYRSVSANVGMSHSMGSILEETTPDLISQWLLNGQNEGLVRNWHLNKMIRPTTLPQTIEELMLEQAFAKEAIRLSLNHHRSIVTGLKGVKIQRQVGDVFTQHGTGYTLVDLLSTKAVIGLGGVISNAPRLSQALSMIVDGIQPEGITHILVDDGSFLPYAGLFSDGSANQEKPLQGFESTTLIGTCVAPIGPYVRPGTCIATVNVGSKSFDVVAGEILVADIDNSSDIQAVIEPKRNFDVGDGKGSSVTAIIPKSKMGLILDGRGRPLIVPKNPRLRLSSLRRWYKALDVYPDEVLHKTG